MAIATPPERATGTGLMIADPTQSAASQLEKVLITGDLAALTPDQRVFYYREVCASVGLNPLTKPFDYLNLNSKLVLYANRSCTDQVRRNNAIEVTKLERERADDLAIVTAYGHDRTGRSDSAIGAVSIRGLAGEALANALMKAETKAKRRLTLALSGLGLLDEVEVDSVPGAWRADVDVTTGEIGPGGTSAPKDLAGRLAERAVAAEAAQSGRIADSAPGGVQGEPQAANGIEHPAAASASAAPEGLDPGSGAAGADVVEGEFTEAKPEGLTAGYLRDWLKEHKASPVYAMQIARQKWGEHVANLDALTDQQRAELRDELAK